MQGPESLIEHGGFYYVVNKIPDKFSRKVKKDRSYLLSTDEIWELGFPQQLAKPILNDLLLQNLYEQQRKRSMIRITCTKSRMSIGCWCIFDGTWTKTMLSLLSNVLSRIKVASSDDSLTINPTV